MKVKTTYTDILSSISERSSLGIEALYRQYANQLRGYAMTQWQLDEDSVWDVIYQTLEALVLKLPNYQFNNQIEFDRLVFKFFLNFLRQYYRKKQKEKEIEWLPINDIISEKNSGDFSPSDVNLENTLVETITDFYESDELRSPNLDKLERCLEQMDSLDRDLLLLRAREYTYEQIAQLLQIENNQLNVKHLRAKQKLVKLFNQLS
jgi:RNA polymerase sigma-70 factor (ECF subfamily)